MIYFVTDQSPASDEVIDAAKAVGAVILHGVPPALAGDIPDGTIGLFEVPEPISLPIPDPEPPADDPLAAVTALLAQVTPDQLARVLALGVTGTEQLTGLPIPVPQPTLEERLTAIEAILTPEAEETLKTLAAFTPETLSAGLDSAVRASVAETIKGETRLDPPSKEGLL